MFYYKKYHFLVASDCFIFWKKNEQYFSLVTLVFWLYNKENNFLKKFNSVLL